MPVNADESVGVLNRDEAVEALHATVTEDGTASHGNQKGFESTSIELERLDPAGPIWGCVALLRSLTVATHCACRLRALFLVVSTSGAGADGSFLRRDKFA